MTGRACRDCKSPAIGNPCWYYTDTGNPGGGDPPCFGELYESDQRDLAGHRRRTIIAVMAIVTLVGAVLILWRSPHFSF